MKTEITMKTENIDHGRLKTVRTLMVAAVCAMTGLASVWAQTAPSPSLPPAPDSPTAADSQAEKVQSNASAGPDQNGPVKLNPFEVKADSDTSYGALNSNSLTRLNVELKTLPVSADIFTDAFMKDIAATSVESMVVGYSAGAGVAASDPTASAGAQFGDHVAHNYIQLRGFDTSVMQRDSLMPVGPVFDPGSTAPGLTSNFDVERVEVINGPQSLLYTGGGPGGVINVVSKMARLGQPAFGSLLFRVDQYGSKESQLDFGAGTDNVAVRFAFLKQDQTGRRLDIGQKIDGYYGQVAVKVFGNTTVRLLGDRTVEHGVLGRYATLNTSSSAADSRQSDSLDYLLATNQAGADTVNAAGQPNASGALFDGRLNWGNVNSLVGWLSNEQTGTTSESLAVDTVWNPAVSSELAVGYSTSSYEFRQDGDLFAPQSPVNPTGQWAIGATPNEQDLPATNKAIRFSIVAKHDLFSGRAHTQTIFGGSFVGSRAYSIAYSYFQADSNFNVIYNPAVKTNNGRTALGEQYYSIAGGIQPYALIPLGAPGITVNGVNYVRQVSNQRDPALVSPTNPLGLTGAGLNEYNIVNNKGFFAANLTQWLDGRLNTLAGARFTQAFDSNIYAAPQAYRVAQSNSVDFDVGANYALLSWLRPYFNVSDVVTPPQVMFPDPAGILPKVGRGVGEEVGVKVANASGTISGSLEYYHAQGTNEEYQIATTLENDINPNGLNGRGSVGNFVDVDRTSDGVQLELTANPEPNWRIRLAAAETRGTILTTKQYGQLYNDQFNENQQGQVTYADGTVVYVNPVFNPKAPVASAATPGALPFTVAMMNNPANPYYANPVNPTGQISSKSAAATVLKTVSPAHGAILTGATGLPLSAIQISPSFALPGTITAFRSGDRTLGYPQFSVDLTSVYTVARGRLKGFAFGGTVAGSWQNLLYYYYPNGFSPTQRPQAFHAPNDVRLDLILGYSHRFRRVTWAAQLNVANLFNHYQVIVLPDAVTGYSQPNNLTAAFFGQPRSVVLTTTLSF